MLVAFLIIFLASLSLNSGTALRFLVDPELVVDDILYDEDELNRHPVPQIDSSFVNYYFDFEADDEIDASLICSRIKNGDKDLIHELTLTNLEKNNNKNRCLDENLNPCFDKVWSN